MPIPSDIYNQYGDIINQEFEQFLRDNPITNIEYRRYLCKDHDLFKNIDIDIVRSYMC